jgi:predicted ferric reductase
MRMDILATGAGAHFVEMQLAVRRADPTLWYVTRAAAVSAYVLLTVSAALGILRSLARTLAVRSTWALDELHSFVAVLAGCAVLLHLGSLLLDPFIRFSPINLVLPLGQPYSPFAVDLGVLGCYALSAVLVSSWLRRRLSYSFWRGLHYAGFAAFLLVTLHGLLAGSDASLPWMRALYVGGAAAVAFLVILRVLLAPNAQSSGRVPQAPDATSSSAPVPARETGRRDRTR